MKTFTELTQIAAAGGGLKLDAATKLTSQLIQIAAAASDKQATITIINANTKTTSELTQIAAAGKGCVVFEFD